MLITQHRVTTINDGRGYITVTSPRDINAHKIKLKIEKGRATEQQMPLKGHLVNGEH